MRRKYMIHPGEVISRNDGNIHYISARQLMKLYSVHPNQCVVATPQTKWHDGDGYMHLHPRFDGDYSLNQYVHMDKEEYET